jgi:hypothetical protein
MAIERETQNHRSIPIQRESANGIDLKTKLTLSDEYIIKFCFLTSKTHI